MTRLRRLRAALFHVLCCAGLVRALCGAALAQQAGAVNLTLGGASAGGFHALLGEAIAETVRREYPDSAIGYEPGSQAGQLVRTVRGEINLSLQTAIELRLAMEGYDVFPRKYRRAELPVIAQVMDRQEIVIFITAEAARHYSVASLGDIGERRVPLRMSFYSRGNLFARGLVFDAMFAAQGITPQALESWGGQAYFVPSAEAKRLIVDRKIDLWLSAAFHPDAKTLEIARAVRLQPLAVDRAIIDRAAARFGLETGYLPAGTYDFLPYDYYTALVPTFILAAPDLPQAAGYRLAKALYTHFEHYRGAHPSFARLKREMLAEAGGFAMHPGAARFFRQVGLLAEDS